MKKRLPKTLLDLLKKLEPQAAAAFERSIRDIKNAIQLQAVIQHLEAGRFDLALVAMRIDEAFFDPVARMLEEAYSQGGRDAVARLPLIPDPFPRPALCSPSTAAHREPRNG